MIELAWDTETALIERGRAAPPITCVSYACDGGKGLIHWKDAKPELVEWLEADDVRLIGQNVAYDMAVICAEWPDLLPLVFEKYEKDLVTDTMLRQKLLDLAEGRLGGFRTDTGVWVKLEYSLEALARRLCKMTLDKDTWRLRYGELRDVPLDQWEPGAREYPVQDAVATLEVFRAQDRRNLARSRGAWLDDQYRQTRAGFAAQLTSVWGLRTNPHKVDKLIAETEEEYGLLATELAEDAWKLVRKDGSRNIAAVRARLAKVMGGEDKCRKTPKGKISTDDEACRSSGDIVLEAYADLTKLKAVISKDVPMLKQGRYLPIHSRWNTLLETGRTSTSAPNTQNLRRLKGIRECFVPREGFVFADGDYSVMELRCLAQVCYEMFGYSEMGDALNAGRDPHLEVASYILDIPYDDAKKRRKAGDKEVENKRQMGKVVNFGCPGGLGAETLTFYAKSNYKVILTIEEAAALKEQVWKGRWKEMGPYMQAVGDMLRCDYKEEGAPVTSLYSNRVRGKCRYTQAANTPFQALASDAAKSAWWLLHRACYVDRKSVLYGSRVVNMIHDQFILEVPERLGHECAHEMARLMVEGAKIWLPDCPPVVDEPLLSRCWSKDAKQVWENGRLMPWTEN
jgi:DNA polymerase I